MLKHHYNCVPNSPVLLLVLTAASSKSPDGTADKNPRIAQKRRKGPAVAQENIAKYKVRVVIWMVTSQISSVSVAGWVPKEWMRVQNISNIIWNGQRSPASYKKDIA